MTGPCILHVDTERGWRGGQNQVYLLHRGLIATGVNSIVVCRAYEPLAQRLAAEQLPLVTISGGIGMVTRAAWAVHRRLTPTTIVHAHAAKAHDVARLSVMGTVSPLLVTRRVDFVLQSSMRSRWKYGPRLDMCVAVSQAVAGVLQRGGVPAQRIAVIYDGVAPAEATPARMGLPTGRVLVLCAAAFAAHKGHRYLIDAWRRIEAAGLPASLLLAGRGELEATVRRDAADLKHVYFLGWREDLPRLWASVDMGVLASVEEGLGSTLIEAQFAGIPVVATTAGGIPEVITHERTGLLVPPADPQALANALQQLITNAALRQTLGAQSVAHARSFHVDVMVEKYRVLYGQVLAARGASTS